MSKPATFDDGIHDGIQVGLFMALRIVKAEKKLHAYNSGAGRVLKTIEANLLKQADTQGTDLLTERPKANSRTSEAQSGAGEKGRL